MSYFDYFLSINDPYDVKVILERYMTDLLLRFSPETTIRDTTTHTTRGTSWGTGVLYDVSKGDFADHVRHATTWNDLGIRCGLQNNTFGVFDDRKLSMLQQKVTNMRLNTDHFVSRKTIISDDDFKTIVRESASVNQIVINCNMTNGKSNEKILKRIADLCIDTKHFKTRKPLTSKLYNKVDAIDDETFKTLLKNNRTWTDFLMACGYHPYKTKKSLADRIEMLGLDTKHFDRKRIDDDKIFVVDSKYTDQSKIKKRLVCDFGRPYECAACKNENFTKCDGVLLWNKKKIVLQIEHINGVHTDNRLENLEFLCPSCHSQTNTYAGGNHKKRKTGEAWLEDGKTEHEPGSISSLLN